MGDNLKTPVGPADPPRPVVSAELLDVKDVAALLGGCSTRHVYRMADGGKMPRPIKLGALVRWRRHGGPDVGVQDWIDAGCPVVRRAGGAR